MRMNTRNMILLVVLVIIIGGLIFYNSRSTDNSADSTPTAVAETGLLFPDANKDTINRFEIHELPQTPDENAEPTATPTPVLDPEAVVETEPAELGLLVMSKDEGGVWTIDESTNSTDRAVDQVTVVGTMSVVAELDYSDRFTLEEGTTLADFGLEEPQYEILIADAENEYTAYVGSKNPGNTRFYVRINDDEETIYLISSSVLNNVLDDIDKPPYVPAPTATPTEFPTANPYSEVEQTATAQVELDASATAGAEFNATATAIAEETALIGPEEPQSTEEATEEMTAEATEEMTAEPQSTEEATEEAAAD